MPVKRERNLTSDSEDGIAIASGSGSSTLAPEDSISADEKPIINNKRIRASAKTPHKASPKSKPSPAAGVKEGKGTKTPWSTQEDTALIDIMDDIIKKHLWPAIKASNNTQLIARTSYGCQYHAKLLMKQNKSANPRK
ncbi:hypothetical protein IAT40_001442 [Kwoniella sp. CBS 6097]